MNNKMKQVAEILGVPFTEDINEPKVFEIRYKNNDYWQEVFLVDEGLCASGGNYMNSGYIGLILTGECEVKRTLGVLSAGDEYWAVWFDENSCFYHARLYARKHRWLCCVRDYQNLHFGNRFATETEAEAAKYDIYRSITGKEWQE